MCTYKIPRFIAVLTLWLCGLVVLMAQDESPFHNAVSFTSLTIDNGLSSNTVRALLQDRHGFVWIGTSRGLNRYDGHRVTVLSATRSMSVTSMVEWGDTLWVGTDNGLFLYMMRTDSLQRYALPMEETSVSDLRLDAAGQLWMATMGQGILCLDLKKGKVRSVPTPAGDKTYGCLCITRKGVVWACSNWTKHKLVRYDAHKGRFVPAPSVSAPSSASSVSSSPAVPTGIAMAEDAQGKLWLGAWDGSLVRLDSSGRPDGMQFSVAETGMQHVHSLLEVQPGYLLVGSDTGLALVDVQQHQVRLHSRGDRSGTLSDSFIYPLMQDREGGTWIGTYYGGVNYTHPVSGNFTSYTHTQQAGSVTGNVVNHFCEDATHRLWIASDDGGLCYYRPDDDSFQPMPLTSAGAQPNVHALHAEGDWLYVGTYTQGLYRVNVHTMAVEHVPQFLDEQGHAFDASSFAISADHAHRIWVGTFQSVAQYHPDSRTFSHVQQVGGLVNAIHSDHTQRLWVATEGNGVWCMDASGAWKHYAQFGQPAGVQSMAYCLFEDGQGNLWVGMANGLFRYDRAADRFDAVQLMAAPASVYGITAVEGHLWLSTSAGILCYSLSEWNVVQVYKGGGNILSTDFLPDAAYRGYDGRVYLGTTSGFIAFRPQHMHRNQVQPQVVFTGLDIFGRPVAVGSDLLPVRLAYMDTLRLSYRENVFRVYFSAMSFLQPSDILYSYYLEGFDDDWIEAGNHQSVTYTNLAPGTYTLHVRATTNDGLQSADATLTIVITPPFYWNMPAKILYLLLILTAIVLVVRHLLRKKERKHVAEMKELNEQKEQEIQEINVQKEQEIQELNEQKEQEVHDARIKFMTINDKDQEFLDKMERVIEQNFSNSDLSVDYLASELGVSRSSLFAKIKALADVTPNEMIQVIRLKHAASLLVTGNYRVNEVCYMVGFSSPSYFAKCFQRQYGCTPAKYKG